MNNTHYAGLEDIQAAPVIARLVKEGQRAVVVTASQGTAISFAKNLSFFLDDFADVVVLPDDDPPFLKADAKSHEAETARLLAMTALSSGKASVVVCPVSMAIRDTCRQGIFTEAVLEIEAGGEMPRDDLIRRASVIDFQLSEFCYFIPA